MMAMQTSFRIDCTLAGTTPCAVRSVISPLRKDTDEVERKRPFNAFNKFIDSVFKRATVNDDTSPLEEISYCKYTK
jgi:hypothetical protein